MKEFMNCPYITDFLYWFVLLRLYLYVLIPVINYNLYKYHWRSDWVFLPLTPLDLGLDGTPPPLLAPLPLLGEDGLESKMELFTSEETSKILVPTVDEMSVMFLSKYLLGRPSTSS